MRAARPRVTGAGDRSVRRRKKSGTRSPSRPPAVLRAIAAQRPPTGRLVAAAALAVSASGLLGALALWARSSGPGTGAGSSSWSSPIFAACACERLFEARAIGRPWLFGLYMRFFGKLPARAITYFATTSRRASSLSASGEAPGDRACA